MDTGTATRDNGMEGTGKMKERLTIRPSNPLLGIYPDNLKTCDESMPRALYLQDSLLMCRTLYTKANNLQSLHEKATFRSTRQTDRQVRLLVLGVSSRMPCLTPQR